MQEFYCLSHTSSPFFFSCYDYFGHWVSQAICLGWPQTVILPILASQRARVTSMSHQHLAKLHSLIWVLVTWVCSVWKKYLYLYIYIYHIWLYVRSTYNIHTSPLSNM
jgi:hypothetical protein